MTDDKKIIPSEFVEFVRDVGIRAFDNLAVRLAPSSVKEAAVDEGTRHVSPIQSIARDWIGMDPVEKEHFFEQMIAAAQIVAASAPLIAGVRKIRRDRTHSRKTQPQNIPVDLTEPPRVAKPAKKADGKKKKADKSDKGRKKDKKNGKAKQLADKPKKKKKAKKK